jgi:hypothetical protein
MALLLPNRFLVAALALWQVQFTPTKVDHLPARCREKETHHSKAASLADEARGDAGANANVGGAASYKSSHEELEEKQ